MSKKKTICFFSGNRAEFGLQKNIIDQIKKEKIFNYKLIISGAHVEKYFADSIKEINKQKYKKLYIKGISVKLNDPWSTTNAIGKNIIEITKKLKKINPDIFLIYADRYESFAAVVASTQSNIPTIHVEGGDKTEGGALDDSLRHAMTKLSHYHFCTNDDAYKRILKLGEEKWRVINVGFPGCDFKFKKDYEEISSLKKEFNLKKNQPIIIFTYHSVPIKYKSTKKDIRNCLKALTPYVKKNCKVIVTYPNNDAGGKIIIEEIKKYKKKFKIFKNLLLIKSLGRRKFYGFLNLAKNKYKITIVGNSSSGIKDASIFNCPTVNIGERQKGRMRGANVIEAPINAKKIKSRILKTLYDTKYLKMLKKTKSPYDRGLTLRNFIYFIKKFSKINKQKILNKKITY